jgi:hypothetical protein
MNFRINGTKRIAVTFTTAIRVVLLFSEQLNQHSKYASVQFNHRLPLTSLQEFNRNEGCFEILQSYSLERPFSHTALGSDPNWTSFKPDVKMLRKILRNPQENNLQNRNICFNSTSMLRSGATRSNNNPRCCYPGCKTDASFGQLRGRMSGIHVQKMFCR